MELSDKCLKASIVKMFQQVLHIVLKQIKHRKSQEIQVMKKNELGTIV